ncbi:hypothetical protein GQ53DRAFT_741626 [Thozetella sp. PMI_491]|nr:hypothetical protein GQ53DRAFT_741626 [Thozetella sp. PMI_491]
MTRAIIMRRANSESVLRRFSRCRISGFTSLIRGIIHSVLVDYGVRKGRAAGGGGGEEEEEEEQEEGREEGLFEGYCSQPLAALSNSPHLHPREKKISPKSTRTGFVVIKEGQVPRWWWPARGLRIQTSRPTQWLAR